MTEVTAALLILAVAGMSVALDRVVPVTSDAGKAAIGLASGSILVWHIFASGDRSLVTTAFAFAAIVLAARSLRRLRRKPTSLG